MFISDRRDKINCLFVPQNAIEYWKNKPLQHGRTWMIFTDQMLICETLFYLHEGQEQAKWSYERDQEKGYLGGIDGKGTWSLLGCLECSIPALSQKYIMQAVYAI